MRVPADGTAFLRRYVRLGEGRGRDPLRALLPAAWAERPLLGPREPVGEGG